MLLSHKFKLSIYKLIEDKEKAIRYDKLQNNNEMELSYINVFQLLRELKLKLLTTDKDVYNNCVCLGILHDMICNNTDREIHDFYVMQLSHLDKMNKESKYIINECLDALDINYVPKKQISESKWKHIVLKIHYNTLLRRIYFLWKTNPSLYISDIIKCIKYFNKMSLYDIPSTSCYSDFVQSFDGIKCDNIFSIFKFMKSLVKKYTVKKI